MKNFKSKIPKMTSNNTPSGIASASSELVTSSSYPAWKAFDKIDDTYPWASSGRTGWLAYEFSSSVIIDKYTIVPNFTLNQAPKNWTFEGSNDGVNWKVLDTQTNQVLWTSGVSNTYVFKNINAYKKYRINVTENNGNTYLSISELEMYETTLHKILLSSNSKTYSIKDNGYKLVSVIPPLTSNTSSSGIASASSVVVNGGAWQAFDGVWNDASAADGWLSAYNAKSGWIQFDYSDKVQIRAYGLRTHAYVIARNPKDWTFEGSNDGINWTILDTQLGFIASKWLRDRWYYFELEDYSQCFSSYRLNILNNNGETYIAVGEMGMFESNNPSLVRLPTLSEKTFINHSMESPINITQLSGVKSIESNSTNHESGKKFTHTIDLSKRRVDKIILS